VNDSWRPCGGRSAGGRPRPARVHVLARPKPIGWRCWVRPAAPCRKSGHVRPRSCKPAAGHRRGCRARLASDIAAARCSRNHRSHGPRSLGGRDWIGRCGPRWPQRSSAVRQARSNTSAPAAGCRRRLHRTDATQAIVTETVAFAALPVATLRIRPPQFGGRRGIGASIVRHDQPLASLLPGTQETGLRVARSRLPLAAGFAHALEVAVHDRETTNRRLTAFRRSLRGQPPPHCQPAGHQCTRDRLGAASCGRHTSAGRLPRSRTGRPLAMAADRAGLRRARGAPALKRARANPPPPSVATGLPGGRISSAVPSASAPPHRQQKTRSEQAVSILAGHSRTVPRVT